MTVLVTGANGFIGRHVIAALRKRSIQVRIAARAGSDVIPFGDNVDIRYLQGPGTASRDWVDAVSNCSAVIHLASRAHVLQDSEEDPVRAFQLANVDFCRACGEAAAVAGVRRFIFISSILVHGNISGVKPFHQGSDFRPHNIFASSKVMAEYALSEIVKRSDMSLTIIRPPLVYGPDAPGNFGVLFRAIARGFPLPLGLLVGNQRSFVAVDNLVDLIITCLHNPSAANQAFLVSDDEDLSTVELLRRLGNAIGRPARLVPIPVGILAFGARILGKQAMFQSLCGSLQVDITHTCETLAWQPSVSVDEGLRRLVT